MRLLVSRILVLAGTILLSVGVVGSSRARSAAPEAAGQYRQYCQRCHGTDGKGRQCEAPASIPDFTRSEWHKQRSDAQLAASILHGKGKDMPPFQERLSEPAAKDLVAHVRAFASGRLSAKKQAPALESEGEFERKFRVLQDNYDQLKRQLDELDSAARRPANPGSGTAKGPREGNAAEDVRRAAGTLYRERCQRCHGADGTGREAKASEDVPDFTRLDWQQQRSDAQLLASILDSKGKEMPPSRDKISEEQARGLVAYVRAFAPTNKRPDPEKQPKSPRDRMEERQRRLQEELEDLKRQFRELSRVTPDHEPPRRAVFPQPNSTATATPAARELFRQRCAKCHGADGTGNTARDRLAEIPDFTDSSWQARHDDAHLLASILDGKRREMPPFHDKISEEEARAQVTRVRAFAANMEREDKETRGERDPADRPVDTPPRGFSEKLVRWLGNLHPPAVHFPIALLTAAAVAVVLRMVTGKPIFDSAARYCLWCGTITAVIAGLLGWFRGSFRLIDASWVMTTHRWLGTSTVVCAVLALLLGEVRGQPDQRQTRVGVRALLLVAAALALVTGFFGGALIYGLDYHAWPP